MVWRSRADWAAMFRSASRNTSASMIRSPDRYSRISSARLSILVAERVKRCPMIDAASAAVSGSSGYRRPAFGAGWPTGCYRSCRTALSDSGSVVTPSGRRIGEVSLNPFTMQ